MGIQLDADRITEEVWCGATLQTEDIPVLVSLGIRRVINLETREHYDFKALARANIELFNVPLLDIDHPLPNDLIEKTVSLIDEAAQRGDQVYVHCTAGWQRSPAIIACYLIHRGISAEESLALVKEKRPPARFYQSHIASAFDYEIRLRSKRSIQRTVE
ncbi:MAG TPA: dual specificity protein phosphatase [Blastocatellia bacterium]